MNPCWICGGAATKKSIVQEKTELGSMEQIGQRCFCDECFNSFYDTYYAERREYARLKKKLMFERAVIMLERQDVDIYEYKEAIEAVQEFNTENLNKFDSSHEIVAAIVLIHNEIKTKIQYSVLNYKADFYLPELKIVLEVDGDRHKGKKKYDNDRDEKIRNVLGLDHEIIRVGTEQIEENAELLVEAIKSIKEERQQIRRKNHGCLPQWYK